MITDGYVADWQRGDRFPVQSAFMRLGEPGTFPDGAADGAVRCGGWPCRGLPLLLALDIAHRSGLKGCKHRHPVQRFVLDS